MLFAYVAVLLITKLTLAGVVPALLGESSFTLLLGVSAHKLYTLSRESRGLPWQRGILAMALAATIVALHNLAWVYGGVVGEVPPVLELIGATLYVLQVLPWAYALSVALFIVYERIRGALYLEIFTYLVGLIAAVIVIVAAVLGAIFSFELGITVADSAGIYLSGALLVPAVALWFSRKDVNLTRPFLLISAATTFWFLADVFYLYLPESYADMGYACLALAQWFLFYRAARVYAARYAHPPQEATRLEGSGEVESVGV